MSVKRSKHFFQLTIAALGLILLGGIFGQPALNSQASQPLLPAAVIKIVDGDTLDVSMAGCRLPSNGSSQECRVQLACIDTPEANAKPFFQQAKDRLAALVPPGTAIMVRDTGSITPDGKRLVGEVFVNKKSVNLQMVREGQAVIYCQHLNNCAGSRNSYLSAEAAAKREGLGVWNPKQPLTQFRETHPCPD
ncbi:MAG: thermonuclease family protein [Oscillatoria princeps RMCB-10]|jgi:micrococcal nuclease|nr:thermonuclease family protein [Oscillatoria princeps RMCB-10]